MLAAYGNNPLFKWYDIPNVGRYNNYELRFHCDFNWLMSAAVEFRKYRHTHVPCTPLDLKFQLLNDTRVTDAELSVLYERVADYALAVLKKKQQEA